MRNALRWWIAAAVLTSVIGPWAGDAVRIVHELVARQAAGFPPGWWLP